MNACISNIKKSIYQYFTESGKPNGNFAFKKMID